MSTERQTHFWPDIEFWFLVQHSHSHEHEQRVFNAQAQIDGERAFAVVPLSDDAGIALGEPNYCAHVPASQGKRGAHRCSLS